VKNIDQENRAVERQNLADPANKALRTKRIREGDRLGMDVVLEDARRLHEGDPKGGIFTTMPSNQLQPNLFLG
jgi:hypothetical protein